MKKGGVGCEGIKISWVDPVQMMFMERLSPVIICSTPILSQLKAQLSFWGATQGGGLGAEGFFGGGAPGGNLVGILKRRAVQASCLCGVSEFGHSPVGAPATAWPVMNLRNL